jgi:hypothetical protein
VESGAAASRERNGGQVVSSVIGSAGAPGASPQFAVNGTLGQSSPVGIGASEGQTLYAGFWKRMLLLYSDVGGPKPMPLCTRLLPNRPNPFRASTTIGYQIAIAGEVEIAIYDLNGRLVRTLVQQHQDPGTYGAVWNGADDLGLPVRSGVYFYRLAAGSHQSVQRMIILQ